MRDCSAVIWLGGGLTVVLAREYWKYRLTAVRHRQMYKHTSMPVSMGV